MARLLDDDSSWSAPQVDTRGIGQASLRIPDEDSDWTTSPVETGGIRRGLPPFEHDESIPVVTREEFNRIECNRCGVCCERIHMPSPLVLAQEIGRYALDRARWPREAIEAMGLEDAMLDRERLIDWWSQFIPVVRVEEEGKPLQYEYRCSRFYRDLEGAGSCTAYEDRPSTCRSFPNGRPMTAIPECSWNVRVVD